MLSTQIDEQHYEGQKLMEFIGKLGANVGDQVLILVRQGMSSLMVEWQRYSNLKFKLPLYSVLSVSFLDASLKTVKEVIKKVLPI